MRRTDTRERLPERVRRALRGGSGQDYEFRGRRKDGTEFWAAADWRPIYDVSGRYMGIRISIRDITQRKEVETRLEGTVQELRKAHDMAVVVFPRKITLCAVFLMPARL